MPIYTYHCVECGPFERVRRVAERADEAPCPTCAASSRRAFDSPHLAGVSPARDGAVEAAGRSAEAPQVATRSGPATDRGHPPGRDYRRYPPLPRT